MKYIRTTRLRNYHGPALVDEDDYTRVSRYRLLCPDGLSHRLGLDDDAIIIAEVFSKKTRSIPTQVIEVCQQRFSRYDEIVGG